MPRLGRRARFNLSEINEPCSSFRSALLEDAGLLRVPSTTPLKQALANRFLIKTKWRWLQQWGAGLALPPTGREAIAQMSVAEPRQGVCHLRHSAGIDLGVIRCLSALGEADARQTSGQQSHNIAAPADHSGIKHSAIMRCDVRCDPERIDIGCLTHRELLACWKSPRIWTG